MTIQNQNEYKQWILDINTRYQTSQIKAATYVNREMLLFYWSLGRDIVVLEAENIYGTGFFDKLSADLKKIIPAAKCFSPTNIRYMKRFYLLVAKLNQNLPQVGEISKLRPITNVEVNLPQVGADLFQIPWGHIKVLIDKCKDDPKKA